MGDQANDVLAIAVGWQRGVDIAVFVDARVGKAQFEQLVHQRLGQRELFPRAGAGLAGSVRSGVIAYIAQKAFIGAHKKTSFPTMTY